MKRLSIRIYGNADADAIVAETAAFTIESALYRADLLQDAISQLEDLYEQALGEAFVGTLMPDGKPVIDR